MNNVLDLRDHSDDVDRDHLVDENVLDLRSQVPGSEDKTEGHVFDTSQTAASPHVLNLRQNPEIHEKEHDMNAVVDADRVAIVGDDAAHGSEGAEKQYSEVREDGLYPSEERIGRDSGGQHETDGGFVVQQGVRGRRVKAAMFSLVQRTLGIGRVLRGGMLQHASFSIFVVVCLIIVSVFGTLSLYARGVSVRDSVAGLGQQALSQFTDAATAVAAADPSTATTLFRDAEQSFLQAQAQVDSLGTRVVAVSSAVPGLGQLHAGSELLRAGSHLASAGAAMSDVAEHFVAISEGHVFATDVAEPSIADLLLSSRGNILTASTELEAVRTIVESIDASALPSEIRPDVEQLATQLPRVADLVAMLDSGTSLFLNILGHETSRTYLLLFQNTSERRALGGFIGSTGLFRLTDGKVTSMDFQNVYDSDGQLLERSPDRIIPPKPLQSVAYDWGLRDANFYADGPTSFEKISSLYEQSGGPTVDGILTMTPQVLEDLLEITGPVYLEDHHVTLSSENIQPFLRETIEQSKDTASVTGIQNDPKNIIGEVAPRILHTLFTADPQTMLRVWSVLLSSLADRHVLLYFHDEQLQQSVVRQGWGGRVRMTNGDYLQVVTQNIGGFKTDAVIDQQIDHHVHVHSDGSVRDTVTITRTHNATSRDPRWYNADNTSLIQVMVPKGSRLVDVKGAQPDLDRRSVVDFGYDHLVVDPLVNALESGQRTDPATGTVISEQFGKTVFENWMLLEPGETKVMQFSYDLPRELALDVSLLRPSDSYSLYWQKQAGTVDDHYSQDVQIDGTWDIVWQHPDGLSVVQDGVTRHIRQHSDDPRDSLVSLVFEQ